MNRDMTDEEVRAADLAMAASLEGKLCEGCPPEGHDTPTRCAPCPRRQSWTCFHCGETFTDRDAAADHFGIQEDGLADEVACRLNATDGLLVKMLREAQEELRTYHQEDNAAFRQFYALGADHATALRHEEEKGYARGIADMRNELTTKIGERARHYASHYPQSSDGRNTFVMFAEWVESLQSPPFT